MHQKEPLHAPGATRGRIQRKEPPTAVIVNPAHFRISMPQDASSVKEGAIHQKEPRHAPGATRGRIQRKEPPTAVSVKRGHIQMTYPPTA